MVVDHEDARRLRSSAATLGSTSSTSVPSPGAERISAVPPSRVSRPFTESRSPRRSSGTVAGSNPLPRSRTKTDTRSGVTSVYRSAAVAPGVLGRVDQRLAGGRAEGGERVVDRGVTDDDRVDDQRVVGLDLGDHAGDEPGPRAALADDLRVVEPGAQLALLAAGQPADRLRVVGVPLDEREGLQHRVVQVRGDRARSSDRMRAVRSSARESSSRRQSGAVARTTPVRITRVAAKPLRAAAS